MARVAYTCAGCEATAFGKKDVKHKDECKKKSLKIVCTKSGTDPHVKKK